MSANLLKNNFGFVEKRDSLNIIESLYMIKREDVTSVRYPHSRKSVEYLESAKLSILVADN